MSNRLQIKYHPAKKEIAFKRFGLNGNEIPIKNLKDKYSDGEKGRFILQDKGLLFFEDIAKTFDGSESVDIESIMTKADYEDFAQMLEDYKKTDKKRNKCNLNLTTLAELPDMNETFSIVEKHGLDSVSLLKEKESEFLNLKSDKESVIVKIKEVKSIVDNEIDNINGQLKELSKNDVVLCLAGVYSSGKSTLVNALLGYAILPEAIKSETAKMFKIKSPKKEEPVRISFKLDNDDCQIEWNEESHVLDWIVGPVENETRASIQKTINDNKSKQRHEQICEILKQINLLQNVDSEINILFPIPLDDENVQFVIYDTPGADSNVAKHQLVLRESLSDQKKSILIYVAAPDKIEGEGNNALLTYIKDAEKKQDNKTCIDLCRSLFVINKIETVKKADDRISLKNCELKNKDDEDFSIKLADKKLFFISAQFAYIAKSIKNQIIDGDDDFDDNKNKFFSEERGRYYQLNQCGSSEYSTKKMIQSAKEAFEKAEDDVQRYIVCSGLYSLEQEIKKYGVKFASAVRAYAIIVSVEKSLATIRQQISMLKEESEEDLKKISRELNEAKESLIKGIDDICKRKEIKENKIPDGVISKLNIDPDSFQKIVEKPAYGCVDKLLEWKIGGGLFRSNTSRELEQKIQSEIQNLTDSYTSNYAKKRKDSLNELASGLIKEIMDHIEGNNQLSDETKETLSKLVEEPKIKEFNAAQTIRTLFNQYIKEEKHSFLWKKWETRYIDVKEFKKDLVGALSTIQSKIHYDCKKDYEETTNGICKWMRTNTEEKINDYSNTIKSKLDDKECMEKLCLMLQDLEKNMMDNQKQLNDKIWEAKNVANR